MYGLYIASNNEESIVKVCSSKKKAESLAIKEISSYLEDNEDLIKKKAAFIKEAKLIKEAISAKEIDSAMDLFGLFTEKLNNCLILTIARVEIMHDA